MMFGLSKVSQVRHILWMIILGFGLILPVAASAAQVQVVRTTSYTYNAETGLPLSETVEPGDPSLSRTSTYTYDSYGNRTKTVESGEGVSARPTIYTYSTFGRFLATVQNPIGHITSQTVSGSFGQALTATDPNGVVSTASYDGFGRQVLSVSPDGTAVQIQYLYCSGVAGGTQACPTLAKYVVVNTPRAFDVSTQVLGQKIGPESRTYFDAANRPLRSATDAFDGGVPTGVVTADTEYDKFGQVVRQSQPYFAGEGGSAVVWSSSSYDLLGRPVVVTAPDLSTTTTTYNGLTTTAVQRDIETGKEILQVTVTNAQGKVVQVTDAMANVIRYYYDPFGNLVKTRDPANNQITAKFDRRGRRTELNDPDLGLRTYTYDVFDQLIAEVDARLNRTDYVYDKLGRVRKRTEVDLISTWTYDTAPMGVGKPATATATGGYAKVYSYDSLGRPASTTETLASGVSAETVTTYDAYGRIATAKMASGQMLAYDYTALGYLKAIRNLDRPVDPPLWTAGAMAPAGAILEETLGNGISTYRTFDRRRGVFTSIKSRTQSAAANSYDIQYQTYAYDAFLNLLERKDSRQKVKDAFEYDPLNRLVRTTTIKEATPEITYPVQEVDYDTRGLGNIATKNDVGTYSYGGANAGPHAVVRIQSDGLDGRINASFNYDANGNMREMVLPGGAVSRSITWTSFDMPLLITQGSSVSVGFVYGPDHQRIKQTAPGKVLFYFSGGAVERSTDTVASLVAWTTYVMAGDKLVATLTREDAALSSASTVRYFHLDHLGSPDRITDASGGILEYLDFDAWGKRRNNTGAAAPIGSVTSNANRGFTGHEQIDLAGLVHMNARLYDPAIGRMISADPLVSASLNLQSFNRYTYGLNNPLSFTDPTGLYSEGLSFSSSYGASYSFGSYGDFYLGGYDYSYSYDYGGFGSYDTWNYSSEYIPVWSDSGAFYSDFRQSDLGSSPYASLSLCSFVCNAMGGAVSINLSATDFSSASASYEYGMLAFGLQSTAATGALWTVGSGVGVLGRFAIAGAYELGGFAAARAYEASLAFAIRFPKLTEFGIGVFAAETGLFLPTAAGRTAGTLVDEAEDVLSEGGRRYWSSSGEVGGKKVYQRDDLIDSARLDSRGRSNLERMLSGLAPIGPDGKPINLHHMLQTMSGPIAEMTQTFHKTYQQIMHINPSSIASGIDRVAFGIWRSIYWKERAKDFQ